MPLFSVKIRTIPAVLFRSFIVYNHPISCGAFIATDAFSLTYKDSFFLDN